MTPKVIFTVGYEGRLIDEFINRLKEFNITCLIDVREIPISRKPGFSKTALKEKAESEHISYFHLRALGSPSMIRHRLKEDHDYECFFRAYGDYLENNTNVLNEAYAIVQSGVSCFMCFEREPENCHRWSVANKIKEIDGNGLIIRHI